MIDLPVHECFIATVGSGEAHSGAPGSGPNDRV